MTASPVIAWPSLAVRAYLKARPRVVELGLSRIATRPPGDVRPLHAVVQSPATVGIDNARYGLARPLVLVEARAAEAAGDDPEQLVMRAAAVLAAELAAARNVEYDGTRWSVLSCTAAFALPVDDSRTVPIFRGAVQAELSMHARTPAPAP